MSTRRKSTLLAAAMVLFAAGPITAQEKKGTRPVPSQGRGQEKAAKEKKAKAPSFVELQIGREAKVPDANGEILGHARSHVVHKITGRILYVVVEGEGDPTRRLVPYHRLRWNADMKKLELPLTQEQLSALPEFRPEDTQMLVDPTPGEGVKGTSGASARPAEGGAREAQDQQGVVLRNVLSNEILSAGVLAGESAFGSVSTLVLEPKRGTIPFVLVKPASASDGKPVVVPWAAMERNADGDFVLSKGATEMSAAPTIDTMTLSTLSDPDTLTRIYRFYGVRRPGPPPVDPVERGAR